MEDHAEHPTRQPNVPKRYVVRSHRVALRYLTPDLGQAIIVRKEVQAREEDRERFLHSEVAIERPLAMKLVDWLQHWRVSRYTAVCDDMLADIVTI